MLISESVFYHPSRWAGALPGHVVTDASILAGAPLLTLRPMLPRGTEILAAGELVHNRQLLLQHASQSPATSSFLMLLLNFLAKSMQQKAVQNKEKQTEYSIHKNKNKN